MAAKSACILLPLLLLAGACAAIDVQTSGTGGLEDRSAWTVGRMDAGPTDARIRVALEAGLRAKGYVARSRAPDFLLSWRTNVVRHRAYHTSGYRAGGTRGRRTSGTARAWVEGFLLLEVREPRTNRLLWRGKAHGALEPGQDLAQQIHHFVAALLEEFPRVR